MSLVSFKGSLTRIVRLTPETTVQCGIVTVFKAALIEVDETWKEPELQK